MCDYDFTYEEISSRMVRTRKVHECGSCMQRFPVGTIMNYAVGKTDGEIGATYACEACLWGLRQPDETPLHFCWGWGWDTSDYPHGQETHDYIRYCLENNEVPTETGLEGVLKQHADLAATLELEDA